MSQISYSELRHDRQSTIRQSKALSIKPKASFKKTISKMQNMILFFYSVAFAAGSCENQGLFKKISFIYETFTKVVLNSLRYKIIIKHASAKGKIRSKMRGFEADRKWSQCELVCWSGIFINMFTQKTYNNFKCSSPSPWKIWPIWYSSYQMSEIRLSKFFEFQRSINCSMKLKQSVKKCWTMIQIIMTTYGFLDNLGSLMCFDPIFLCSKFRLKSGSKHLRHLFHSHFPTK